MKITKRPDKIVYCLLIIFVLILLYFFVPFLEELKQKMFFVVAIMGFLFFVLGILLLIFARHEKKKLFLLIIGISAISVFLFSILHNLFYALAILWPNMKVFFEILHVTSFIISLLVAPIMFVVGAIGRFVQLKKS